MSTRKRDVQAASVPDTNVEPHGVLAIDWERFGLGLRDDYGDQVVDEAIARLRHGDVWEWEDEDGTTKFGVRVRRDLGDDRTQSGAKSYWPEGTRQGKNLKCLCHEFKTTAVCGHALARMMYRWWRDEPPED